MNKQNIICMDDQREVLSAIKRELEVFSTDYNIVECESASEAEELFREFKETNQTIALIICDHIMPGENGIDFLARMASEGNLKNIKSIVLTGLASHQDTIKAINEAKIDYYLEKPWDSEEFVSIVRKLIQ